MKFVLVFAGTLVLLLAPTARAAVLQTVATGFTDQAMTSLGTGGSVDVNFKVTRDDDSPAVTCTPGAPCNAYVATENPPNSPWSPCPLTCGWSNGANSKWIAPLKSSNGGTGFAPGDVQQAFGVGFYDYSFTFNLAAGIDPTKVDLIGLWWTDNTSTTVTLNGVQLSGLTTVGKQFASPSSLFVSNAILGAILKTGAGAANQNVLTFEVFNGDTASPTGLRVEGAFVDMPEPGTLGVVGAGLLSLLALARRRR